jgi:hypothetical protein
VVQLGLAALVELTLGSGRGVGRSIPVHVELAGVLECDGMGSACHRSRHVARGWVADLYLQDVAAS